MPEPILELVRDVMSHLEEGRDFTLLAMADDYPDADIQAFSADLNGDSLDETILGAVFPPDDPFAPGGFVGTFIFSPCGDGEHDLIPISGQDFEYVCRADWCSYRIIVNDIIGLGLPQVLVAFEEGFFNWSYPLITVTGWHEGHLVTYLHEQLEIGPLISLAVYDSDQDGSQEISVLGYRLGTAAREISRRVFQRYEWQPDQFALVDVELLPPSYRFQVLEDAQRALDNGDLHYAIALYLAAADGDYLNVPSFGGRDLYQDTIYSYLTLEEVAGEYQTSFARFRLIYLYEFIGQYDDVDCELQKLQSYHPTGEPGSEFAELAALFVKKARHELTPSDACRESVRTIINTYPDLTGFWGHIGSWGNTNLYYIVDNLCPDS
jgi:hypothetical protein